MVLRGVSRIILRVILGSVLRIVLRGGIYDDLVIVIKRFVIRVNDPLIKRSAFLFSAICLQISLRMFMGPNIIDHECITGEITPLDHLRLSRRIIIDHECITGEITPLDHLRLSPRLIIGRVFIVRMVNRMVSIHDGIVIALIFSTVEMIMVIFFIRGVNSNDDSIFAILKGRRSRRGTATISGGVETKVVNGRSARNHCTLSVWHDGALTDHWVWLSNVRNDRFVIREIESTVSTQ